jgi:molecular chaperone DnaJ
MPTVQFKDYYQTLGLQRDADEKLIRTAYRKLARQHHPDINPGVKEAEERFKDINEAYEVLSDAEKRKLYDRFGEDWQRYRDAGFTGDEPTRPPDGAGRRGFDPNDFGAWFSGQQTARGATSHSDRGTFRETIGSDDAGGFSDFFQTLFGDRGRETNRGTAAFSPRSRRQRGQDVEVPIEINFDEAFRGATRRIDLRAPELCATCNGTGLARDITCPTCDGTGVVTRTKALEVTIPAGVATGARVRVAGQGGVGEEGGPNGDVYLRITVRSDPRFDRDGDDLRTEIEVPLTMAMLGGEAVVPTPTGRVALTIPAETQPGRVFRLRGQGMPRLKGKKGDRGDLLAQARVGLPTGLTDQERALFEELRKLRPEGKP